MSLLLGNRPTPRRVHPGQLQFLPPVPVPAGEAARLAALHRYQILDTSPAQVFVHIAQMAADTAHVPVALISLVDRHRQWFLAGAGLAEMGITVQETPREIAFCAYTIMGDGLLVVEDATRDDRFRNNPVVTGPLGIRFYAGVPLLTRDGHALGSLCLIDRQPRRLDPVVALALPLLAQQVVDQLELRLVHHQLHQAKRALATIADHYSHRVRLPLASLLGIVGLIDPETLTGENRQLYEMLCETARNMDDTIHEVVHTANVNYELRMTDHQLPMTNNE
ncbi:MAG: GAF domain-containing protein [Cytophagales bacterium]|nr:GAF domain-containing protein [Cytophagales bacterium]